MEIFITAVIFIFVLVVLIFLITGLTGAPYVPSHKQSLSEAFKKLLPLKSSDLLIDLGAGDGVVLEAAAEHGAKALGIELNPLLAFFMKFRFRNNKNISIKCQNFYRFKFPKETTVVYAFAASLHIEPIYRKIREESHRLGKPIYFISNAFDLKDQKPIKRYKEYYLYKIQ